MADFVPRVFTQTFGVVGGLLEKDGKFLLVRESQRKGPDHGKWSQPAGWIDVGEDPVTAGKREIEEETGVEFTPKALLGVYSLLRKDIEKQSGGTPHAIKFIFLGDFEENKSKLHDDISEIKWFTPEEIESMNNKTLRDLDVKQMVKDYLAGKSYPLELITHTVSKA
jgi:ADP-ribose pyrophosphatase YjhB (NUDIX family)